MTKEESVDWPRVAAAESAEAADWARAAQGAGPAAAVVAEAEPVVEASVAWRRW